MISTSPYQRSSILLLGFLNLRTIIAQSTNTQVTYDEIIPSTGLRWQPCYGNYECAKLEVPLDYSQPNGTRASIPLIKIPAQLNGTDGKYQGMILMNPGGPGGSGISFMLDSGYSTLFPVVPKTYDLVSWDPRGMGYSTPYADCGLQKLFQKSKRAYGLSGPDVSDKYYENVFQTAAAVGKLCQANIGGVDQAGPHMSTPVVVRDMISILDAFAETEQGKSVDSPKDINYWGFSYGSVLGQTFASMFPDRVGRFAMDGIEDPEDYYNADGFDIVYNVDAVFDLFFEYCFQAGPALCTFHIGTSSKDIKRRFLDLFANFQVGQAYAKKWDNSTLLDDSLGSIMSIIRPMTYTPVTGFPKLAQTLIAYENALKNLTLDNIEAAGQIAAPVQADIPGHKPDLSEWTFAVLCPDSGNRLLDKTLDDYRLSNKKIAEQSYIGHVGISSIKIFCSGWSIEAKEKFTGTFGAATKNPILFISNTVDPATPIENSYRWVPHYKDAQLLTIDTPGHCSFVANNSCANAKIYNFFKTGQLPGRDNFCSAEVGAFGVTLKDLTSLLPSANFTAPTGNTTQGGVPTNPNGTSNVLPVAGAGTVLGSGLSSELVASSLFMALLLL